MEGKYHVLSAQYMLALQQVLNILAAGIKHYFALCCGLGKFIIQESAFLVILKRRAVCDSSQVLPKPLELKEMSHWYLLEVI